MATQLNVPWSPDTALKPTQERLAFANAVRIISTVFSDLESSCQALLVVLRQHEHQARHTAEDLQELAHQSQLGLAQVERVTQGIISSLPPISSSASDTDAAGHLCTVLSSAVAVEMSNWSCKAPAAVAGHHLQHMCSSVTDVAADALHRIMQHVLYALQQLLHSSQSCKLHHDCSTPAKDALLAMISTAYAGLPNLQRSSCMAGLMPCLLTSLDGNHTDCLPHAMHVLAAALSSRVSTEAIQSGFCDDLIIPLPSQHADATDQDAVDSVLRALEHRLEAAQVTGSPHGVAVHDVMQIGRAVLLGPAGKPTLKLWPILLSDIANVLKLSAEGTERTPSPDADQAAAQHAAHEEPDVAAAIQTLAIVTARCLGEATTSNAAIKLLPTDLSFLRSLSVLLLKSLQQYSSHRLGGILVILAAALAQLYAEEPMVTAEDPVMKEAVATGLESEVVLWLLGPPGTGVEVRDFCQAALCEGARLTSQQFQHLMILLAAWYHCDVYLCEAGSSIGRLATVKDWLGNNVLDWPSLSHLWKWIISDGVRRAHIAQVGAAKAQQQLVRRPPTLMTVIYEVPALIDTVIAAQAGGPLLASSSTLRLLVQQRIAAITLKGQPSFCTFVSQSWPRLQSLSLECGSLGTDSMALLATAALPGLTSLSLRANALDHQNMSILVKSHFPKLLILDLSHNRLDLSAMRYFITGKWSLRSVNLSHNQLNSAAVKALTQAPSKCLDTLDVSCNEIDAGGIAALGQAKWRQLKHLRVSISHQDTTFALESLGKADFPVLQSLDLQSSWLQHQTVGQLSRLHQLTALNLSNSQLTWDCVRDLVQTAWGRKLQQLNFSRNKLGWIFTVDLIQADWANLQVLDLSWTGLGSEDNEIFSSCEYLCQGKWPLLQSLLLAGNGLTVDGIEDLTKGNWPLLQTLDLSSNFLTPHAVSQLTEASWPQLQELRLATNSFCMRDSYLADILSLAEPPLRPGCNCIVAPHTVAGGCWPQLQLLDLSG